jgi:hypothetical protein
MTLSVLALSALPAVLLISGQIRADQIEAQCHQSQKGWDTLHAVIEASVKPSADGTALDHLVIPDNTPASVIEILRQLTVQQQHPAPSTEVLAALGARPTC